MSVSSTQYFDVCVSIQLTDDVPYSAEAVIANLREALVHSRLMNWDVEYANELPEEND